VFAAGGGAGQVEAAAGQDHVQDEECGQ